MRCFVRVAAVAVGFSIPLAAHAWEEDGFRSGMTLAEAMAVVASYGQGALNRIKVSGGPKNAYSVTIGGKNGWNSYGYKLSSGELQTGAVHFCSDVLYGYDRLLPGGFEAFVKNTEREASRLGAATLQSFSRAPMQIVASWSLGNDSLSFGLDKFYGEFSFSRAWENLSVCPSY
jgi:hypothetical protein